MGTPLRFQADDRIAFDRGRAGPVFGTVTEVVTWVNGTASHAVRWVEDLDGAPCCHPINDQRLRLVKRP